MNGSAAVNVCCVKRWFFVRCRSGFLWRVLVFLALLLGGALLLRSAESEVVVGSEVSVEAGHFVRLFDGTALHGQLTSLAPGGGLVWAHPDAVGSLRFDFSALRSIRFNPSVRREHDGRLAECRFRFVNGDEVYGRLVGMDEATIGMETEFGGALRAARESIRSIAFLQNGYRVLYEGPNRLDEWVLGKSPNGWGFRDGMLSATNRGVIGREMGISDSASLAFDLHWEGTFQLSVTMHAETVDRYDYNKGAYVFSLNHQNQTASFQRIQPGSGVMTLGQVSMTNLVSRTKARFDLRTHREKASFALLVDGDVVGSWNDSRGFVAQGSGVSFSWQMNNSSVSLGQILLTEWDGLFERDLDMPKEKDSDGLLLVNRDQPLGLVRSIEDGSLSFQLRRQMEVKIPLERIKQIQLRQTDAALVLGKDDVRVWISGGGSLSFALSDWTDAAVEGMSGIFGAVRFRSDSIRYVELNLERHRLEGLAGQEDPDDVWDFSDDE